MAKVEHIKTEKSFHSTLECFGVPTTGTESLPSKYKGKTDTCTSADRSRTSPSKEGNTVCGRILKSSNGYDG